MKRIAVLQVTDTLAAGGLERVAVNVANHLPEDRYRSYFCITRQSGPLEQALSGNVRKLHLARTGRFDLRAMRRLARFIRQNRIDIVHAHGTSLFISAAAVLLARTAALVWHDHYGRCEIEERPRRIYRAAARLSDAVIAVNQSLAAWAKHRLRVPADRVFYIPNFVCDPGSARAALDLPGRTGYRVVCVANFRPQKDHLTLLRAMKQVSGVLPQACLFLLGEATDRKHFAQLQSYIANAGLNRCVFWLGTRPDVPVVLRNCDIGVLSSASEGLPLALLEYGSCGLAAVATDVGQCREVLDEGRAGVLVPAGRPEALGREIAVLLQSPSERARLAGRLSERVREHYSAAPVLERIGCVYQLVLNRRARR